MRLEDLMTTDVQVVGAEQTADDAYEQMRRGGMHHLVVTLRKAVIGVVSDRDLGGPRGARLRKDWLVGNLMTSTPVTATPEMTLRSAANLLRGRGIGCLPVLDNGKLVGIVTLSDVLDAVGQGRVGRTADRSRPAPSRHQRRIARA